MKLTVTLQTVPTPMPTTGSYAGSLVRLIDRSRGLYIVASDVSGQDSATLPRTFDVVAGRNYAILIESYDDSGLVIQSWITPDFTAPVDGSAVYPHVVGFDLAWS